MKEMTRDERERLTLEMIERSLVERYIMACRLQAALKEDDIDRVKYWAKRIVEYEIPTRFTGPEEERDFKERMQRSVREFKARFAHLDPVGNGLAAAGPEDSL